MKKRNPVILPTLAVLALMAGMGIAWIDTRPTWDDTGITAGALLLAAGTAAFFGVPWWGAALLVAAPILGAEFRALGWGMPAILAIATAGAVVGALAGRTRRASGSRPA